jgi:hypothetical protein
MSPLPTQTKQPQHLELPQEMVDAIAAAIDGDTWLKDIKALRFTCRTFGNTLMLALLDRYFNTSSTEEMVPFVLFLDDEGIKDIEFLADTPIAPYVKWIKLADRVPSPYVLKYQEKQLWSNNVVSSTEITQVDMEGFSALNRRQRTAFAAQFHGWQEEHVMMNCTNMRHQDLRTPFLAIRRLAKALSAFPNLVHLTTAKQEQVNAKATDRSGAVLKQTAFHGNHGWRNAPDGVVTCKCGGTNTYHSGYGCLLKTDDVVWPATLELAQLATTLTPTSSLFTSLLHIELNFYQDPALKLVNNLQVSQVSNLASFIGQCSKLQTLKLRAQQRWLNPADQDVPAIQALVEHLAAANVILPQLREMSLDHIGPASPALTTFLSKNSSELRRIYFDSCINNGHGDAEWGAFCQTVSQVPHLQEVRLAFLKKYCNTWPAFEMIRRAMDWVPYPSQVAKTDVRAWFGNIAQALSEGKGNDYSLLYMARSML